MITNPQKLQPAGRPADRDTAASKANQSRTGKFRQPSRIEPVDWRGEGVVGDRQTD